jgi:hypothetical protein
MTDIERHVPPQNTIHLPGGAVGPAMIRAKQEWLRPADCVHEEDSSVKGAALLACLHVAQASRP